MNSKSYAETFCAFIVCCPAPEGKDERLLQTHQNEMHKKTDEQNFLCSRIDSLVDFFLSLRRKKLHLTLPHSFRIHAFYQQKRHLVPLCPLHFQHNYSRPNTRRSAYSFIVFLYFCMIRSSKLLHWNYYHTS